MSRGFEDFFHWRGGSFHWHGGFTVERTARLPGGGQGRGPAQSCEGRGPPSLHPPPWPRYTLRVLLVCLLRGLAHSVRSACGAALACSLRSLRVWGCEPQSFFDSNFDPLTEYAKLVGTGLLYREKNGEIREMIKYVRENGFAG